MKQFAIIAISDKLNASEIFYIRMQKMPTLKIANKELKLRNRECRAIAVVEVGSVQNCVYESMAWNLSPLEGSLAVA
jgi:phage gp16-like protein